MPTPTDSEILRARMCPKSHSPSTQTSSPELKVAGAHNDSPKNLSDDQFLFFCLSTMAKALIQCFEVSALGLPCV